MAETLLSMVTRLAEAELAIRANATTALERVAVRIEKTAVSEFGVYQPAVGDFDEWPDLADSTQEERARLGYAPDEPLLREGDLRDSMEHHVEPFEAVIGSTSELMPYHEFGTEKIPPRPVLGPALVRNEEAIRRELGGAVVAGLIGANVAGNGDIAEVHESLGYNKVIDG